MRRLTLLIFILIPVLSYGQYHVDPNNLQTIQRQTTVVTNDAPEPRAHKIVINNGYSQKFTILVSDNNKKWDTIILAGKDCKTFKDATKYIRIYSAKDKFKSYKLNSGFSYSMTWDNAASIWVLQ